MLLRKSCGRELELVAIGLVALSVMLYPGTTSKVSTEAGVIQSRQLPCLVGLYETATPNQASQIVKLENIGEHEVIVAPHFTLNQSKDVVSEAELQNDTAEEILKLLENQNVRGVSRINIRKMGKQSQENT
ncbi:hypothetical protein AVEN_105478-1 [Araneus ventricosus]|uniref:Uncharacterized protein n=1 Tax=Araneus ventricosus TaxID=182803 RepID=A0A4Y2GLC2_ARAVE|nr:hypothetical protein AVEN_105478-1 [Araneus ventricosus]